MSAITKANAGDCTAGCFEKLWLKCALETLQNNSVSPFIFAEAIRTLLIKGCGKHRNILIIGPSNCAKTFLIKPLEKIFQAFSNPAQDKYGWIGVDQAEVIVLNDLRWDNQLISWIDFLLLLEGELVNLPAPKNHFARDICLKSDTPIFATSKEEILFRGRYNNTDYIQGDGNDG